MKNIHIFSSGEYYTLSQIFTKENKIIIPDLQRDYCWGNNVRNDKGEKTEELVSGFVQNLLKAFTETPTEKLILGLIYGYEQPKYHIQLCDGQQRITTLFLLLGMLNRKTINEENKPGIFHRSLISDFKLTKDDKEPYLQYAIRESTLYFLSDLVCEFFLKSNIEIADITKQDWYFSEYDLDASIQSMLAALATIENKINGVDFPKFGNFILNNLQMLYYDMGDRTHGEETFVVINTTGEPLTATENLKPVLLGNIANETEQQKFSEQWEEREDWFWQNRTPQSKTADGGVKDFFVWYWQIQLLQEQLYKNKKAIPLNPKDLFVKQPETTTEEDESPSIEKWAESSNLNTVHSYFQALKKLIELCKDIKISTVLKTIENAEINLAWFRKVSKSNLHVVLPLIAYLQKFNEPTLFFEFVRRIRKNHFDKIRDYRKGNFVDWRHIVQIIEFSENEYNMLSFEIKKQEGKFKNIANVDLNEWYNEDEQKKDILKKIHKEDIEIWEDNPDLMGYLTPLWNANADRDDSYANMKHIWDNFELLYNCYDKNEAKKHPELCNWVRLYRILTESGRLGGIYRAAGMKGAWFSWKSDSYLNDKDFMSLCKLNNFDLINEIKNRVKSKIPKTDTAIDDTNFSAEQHLKLWLLTKVLHANAKLLAFYDGRSTENGEGNGLASYDDCTKNKLNSDLPFTLGNSICGYAVKRYSYIEYATDDNWWQNKYDEMAFDCSIGEVITGNEFNNRLTTKIAQEKIDNINDKIKTLIDSFY
ncbi:MAG: DUF262 domain-containing protein [Candidatus Azobacteroides sp.]|nr:DUF262 domain-containing protein [Candidatus Azobacteroides sp.]